MADFDPYFSWLNIPVNQRPINHYKFLGLIPPISNVQQIEQACNQRRELFQKELLGIHGVEAQMMLGVLKDVSDTLLNPVRKEAYDKKLFSSTNVALDTKFEPGYIIGQYELLSLQDKSNSGIIWKVKNTSSGKIFLMKILPKKMAQRPEVAKRFLREIQLASQLNHENIVSAVDSDSESDPLYYVMPCQSLVSLEELCRKKGLPSVDTVLDYICQAARGLEYLHWKGIYHRNIRPDVLFIDENNNVKVGGLLTAKMENNLLLDGDFDEQLTQDGQMLGAIDYMAPEQAINAAKADRRCDIYSLGCTMHWLLSGRPVFNIKESLARKIMAHQKTAIPDLSHIRGDIPPALDAVFHKMLAKKPEDRYQSMKEVIEAITEARKSYTILGKIPFWAKITIACVSTALLGVIIYLLIK